MVCLALELIGSCVVLGFSVGMEAFDELLSMNVPWNQEFPGVRVDFPGKNTGVGCHFLLQGNFPTQGPNPGVLYCRLSPALQVVSLLIEPPGKFYNVGGPLLIS